MKVTVVGAGNVGATCANVLAHKEIANEIVLLDIKEGFAEGKALDIWETSPINLYDSRTIGQQMITQKQQTLKWLLLHLGCQENQACLVMT
jgi:malate/lactate dehydrogenase